MGKRDYRRYYERILITCSWELYIFILYLLLIIGPLFCFIFLILFKKYSFSQKYSFVALWILLYQVFLILSFSVLDYFFPDWGIFLAVLFMLLIPVLVIIASRVRPNPEIYNLSIRIFGINILFILLGIFLSSYISYQYSKSLDDQLINAYYDVNTAILNFRDKNGTYPFNIKALFQSDFLKQVPQNPYYKNESILEEDFNKSPKQGDFTYLTLNENGVTNNYYLIVYSKNGFLDIDGDGESDNVLCVYYSEGLIKSQIDLKDHISSIEKLIR